MSHTEKENTVDKIYAFCIENNFSQLSENERIKKLLKFVIDNKLELNDQIYFAIKKKQDCDLICETIKKLLEMFIFDKNFND